MGLSRTDIFVQVNCRQRYSRLSFHPTSRSRTRYIRVTRDDSPVCTVRYNQHWFGNVNPRLNLCRVTVVDDRGSRARFSRLGVPAQTTMIRYLPPEILDLIVDHLRGEPTTLRACCLVSKSWVPRSRRHLFARVEFIGLWRAVFPDPLNSPAHYTRSLTITSLRFNNDVIPWIRSFRSVVHLHVKTLGWNSLVLFRGLSHTVRSLRLDAPNTLPSVIFDLICSFPLLEDIALFTLYSEDDDWTGPPSLPKFARSLSLSGMIIPVTRRLLDLPTGLHFTKVTLELLHEADFELAIDLVSRCSDTLESLDITEDLTGVLPSPSVADRNLTTMIRASHDLL